MLDFHVHGSKRARYFPDPKIKQQSEGLSLTYDTN